MDLRRCPHCSAAVRPDAAWCGLCYVDLRAPARPEPALVGRPGRAAGVASSACSAERDGSPASTKATVATTTTPTTTAAAAAAEQSAADGGAEGGWPCSRCSTVVSLSEATCPSCGSAFLAPLAGDGGRHRSSHASASGRAGRLPRPARLVVGAFVGLLLAVLLPLVLALLG